MSNVLFLSDIVACYSKNAISFVMRFDAKCIRELRTIDNVINGDEDEEAKRNEAKEKEGESENAIDR